MGEDVVNPTPDNSERDRNQCDIEHNPGLRATGNHTPIGESKSHEDSREDAQGVGVDREVEGCPIRSEVSQELPDIEDLP